MTNINNINKIAAICILVAVSTLGFWAGAKIHNATLKSTFKANVYKNGDTVDVFPVGEPFYPYNWGNWFALKRMMLQEAHASAMRFLSLYFDSAAVAVDRRINNWKWDTRDTEYQKLLHEKKQIKAARERIADVLRKENIAINFVPVLLPPPPPPPELPVTPGEISAPIQNEMKKIFPGITEEEMFKLSPERLNALPPNLKKYYTPDGSFDEAMAFLPVEVGPPEPPPSWK